MDNKKIEYPPTGETFSEKTKEKRGTIFFLTLFTVVLSIPELPLPPGPRQGELLYYGWAVTEGLVPYRDFWDNGSPGVYFIYAVALKIFGHSYEAINLFDIMWRCFTMLAVYALGTRLFGRGAGVLAGVIYATAASLAGSVFNCNALSESFCIFPLALGMYFFLDERMRFHALSGIFMALAVVIKLPVILIMLAMFGVLAVKPRETWEPHPKRAKVLGFLYGVIVVFSLLFIYISLSWAIDDFLREVIIYNLLGGKEFLLNVMWPFAVLVTYLIFIMGSAKCIHFAYKRTLNKDVPLLKRTIPSLLIIAVIGYAFVNIIVYFMELRPNYKDSTMYLRGRINKAEYLSRFHSSGNRNFTDTFDLDAAEYINDNTDAEEKVLIVARDQYLNFLSERLSPVSITNVNVMMAYKSTPEEMKIIPERLLTVLRDNYKRFKEDLFSAEPKYIVWQDGPPNILYDPGFSSLEKWDEDDISSWLLNNYSMEIVIGKYYFFRRK